MKQDKMKQEQQQSGKTGSDQSTFIAHNYQFVWNADILYKLTHFCMQSMQNKYK